MSDKLAKFDFFQSSPIEHNNFDNPLEKTAERSLILAIFRHGKYDFLIYFICILENSNNSIFRHFQGSPNGRNPLLEGCTKVALVPVRGPLSTSML